MTFTARSTRAPVTVWSGHYRSGHIVRSWFTLCTHRSHERLVQKAWRPGAFSHTYIAYTAPVLLLVVPAWYPPVWSPL